MGQKKTGREMMEEIRNRRSHRNDLLRAVADMIDGYDYDYLQSLTGENGDRWLEEVIAELFASTQKQYEPEKKELYYSFLYCTLLGIAWDRDLCHLSMDYGDYGPARVWGDVVCMARDTGRSTPGSKEDLLFMESVNYTDEIRGFFGYMPEVYFLLRGQEVYFLYTEEEKAFVGQDRITLEKRKRKTAGPTIFEDPCEAEDEEESDTLSWEDAGSAIERAKEGIVGRIPDPEKYIRNYLRFRELSYTGAVKGELTWDREEFINEIEEMVDCYLYRKGYCVYSLEELSGMVMDCLRKVTKEMFWTMQIGKDYKHWLETGTKIERW